MQLKPIQDQVVVVLGAASGIGRECALRFAGRGAKVMVAARSEPGLVSLVGEIVAHGGEATYVVCDAADFVQVEAVATETVRAYGRIDTWVNVAGVGIYAAFQDTSPEEFRRMMEINYLGQVHGALAALGHLRQAGQGALIAVSSVEGVVALPLHSSYSASKHAVDGAFDALRRELAAEGAPISVTTVRPATINTPFFNNSRNKLEVKPQAPPPFYQPNVVADCVLYAAGHPVRDLYAGGAGRAMALGQLLAPKLLDAVLARVAIPLERTHEPEPGGFPGVLFDPNPDESRVEGDFSAHARGFSLYTWLQTHQPAGALAAAGMLAGTALLLARAGRPH